MRHTVWFLLFSVVWLSSCSTAEPTLPPPPPTSPPPPTAGEPNTLRLTNGEWPPYNGENLPHGGCEPWIVKEALALQGVKTEFGFFPWARALHLSTTGEWDGALSWSDTPEHQETHFVSADYTIKQEWVFFHRQDFEFDWEEVADIEGLNVGVTVGYVYSNAFTELMEKNLIKFDEAPADEANFEKLLAGRIDIFPMELNVGYTTMRKLFTPEQMAEITHHPKPLQDFLPHVLFSRVNPENEAVVAKFDAGLAELKSNGRFEEIMAECLAPVENAN